MKRAICTVIVLLCLTATLQAQHGHGGGHNKVTLTVSAGPNQSIILPNTAVLSGSYTVQPVGSTVTFVWSKSSGPSSVTFGDATALSTTAAFGAAGSYTITLTGKTGKVRASSSLTVSVAPDGSGGGGGGGGGGCSTPVAPKLAWDTESGVTGYNVYRGTSATSFSATPLNGGTPLTTAAYTDTSVQCSITYYYTVRSVNAGGESTNSNVISYQSQ